MTSISLGQMLATQLAETAEQQRASDEAKALLVQTKTLARCKTVASFFERAKTDFTKKISAGVPAEKLGILLGTPYGRRGANLAVYRILGLDSGKVGITEETHPMHLLWADFVLWCAKQGLEPEWRSEWDGGGRSSWYVLTVRPMPYLTDVSDKFVNPNDVRLQHNYCLHVLYSTACGLIKAGDALYALQGHPVAASALKALEPLLKSTRELKNRLDA